MTLRLKPLSVNCLGKAQTPPPIVNISSEPINVRQTTSAELRRNTPDSSNTGYHTANQPPNAPWDNTNVRRHERSADNSGPPTRKNGPVPINVNPIYGAMIHLRDQEIFDLTLTAQPYLTTIDRACLPAVSQETIVHHYRYPDLNVKGREI